MAKPKPLDVEMRGKTCLVTGANTGIGRVIAGELARMGARVLMGCRSQERGQAARDAIRRETGSQDVDLRLVDLSSRASIEAFAAGIRDELDHLDVLVNNAGVWMTTRRESVDGIELTFATNVLGYFHLSNLLVPLLEASARTAGQVRIVNVASKLARDLDLDDLQFVRRPYDGIRAYAQSKQCNRMLSWLLAERLEGRGITVNAMHPGPVATELARDGEGLFGTLARGFFSTFGRTPAHGADTAVYLAVSPEAANWTGRFWQDRRRQRRSFYNAPAMKTLWERCEELIGSGG